MRFRHLQRHAAAAVVCITALGLVVPSASASRSHGSVSLRLTQRSSVFVGSPSSGCPAPLAGAQFNAPAIHGGARTIALTFDDGPGRSTAAILAILRSFHVRATFFNVGSGEATWPELVRQEAAQGYLLGDHTIDHKELTLLSPAGQAAEMDGVIHEQRVLVQSSPCVFRPPYGAYNATTVALSEQRRMSMWMWNAGGGDWEARGSGSAYWVNHIVSAVESEGIGQRHVVVLLHNQPIAMPATVAALPTIITFFLRRGYQFIDLLGRTGPPASCGTPDQAPARVPSTTLAPGGQLASGKSLKSPGGQFILTMQPKGDLVLRLATGRTLWSTKTEGHPGARLVVEPTGDVVVRSTSDVTLWSSGTAAHPGARFALRNDGKLAILHGATSLWSTATSVSQLLPGERLGPWWRLTSPNGLCHLVQQPTGPLTVLSSSGQTLWNSGTTHHVRATSVLQSDGMFAVFTSKWTPLWQSWTGAHPGSRLAITNEGALVITSRTGARIWATP